MNTSLDEATRRVPAYPIAKLRKALISTPDELACEKIMAKAYLAGVALERFYHEPNTESDAIGAARVCRRTIMQELSQAYLRGCVEATERSE
jgi:hypothetical protein